MLIPGALNAEPMSERYEMTGEPDPLPTEIETTLNQLSETWERLQSSHKLIGGGCSCGHGGIVLGLADFEQDIVDYLRNEGEQHQRRDVLVLLESYARDGDGWSVASLLKGLSGRTTSIDPEAAKFVTDRLTRTVQSFEELHGGR